jgi:DNA modification methylase
MEIDEKTYKELPENLKNLFYELPNPQKDEVLEEFAKYGKLKSGSNCIRQQDGYFGAGDSKHGGLGKAGDIQTTYGDSGSAARFFYSAKASAEDRAGSKHPTVKPLKLISYLIKLVTPVGGTVLDPFAGSGTTGQAAVENGFYPIMIEMTPEYQKDIEKRMEKFEDDAYFNLFEQE